MKSMARWVQSWTHSSTGSPSPLSTTHDGRSDALPVALIRDTSDVTRTCTLLSRPVSWFSTKSRSVPVTVLGSLLLKRSTTILLTCIASVDGPSVALVSSSSHSPRKSTSSPESEEVSSLLVSSSCALIPGTRRTTELPHDTRLILRRLGESQRTVAFRSGSAPHEDLSCTRLAGGKSMREEVSWTSMESEFHAEDHFSPGGCSPPMCRFENELLGDVSSLIAKGLGEAAAESSLSEVLL
mmetsp:Transcript_4347/g.10893  ORF Transcript_4347/g.10893 Transcript_4347/m.10893 type:complete len:240 (+) Transcript_4347:484-1203(+)